MTEWSHARTNPIERKGDKEREGSDDPIADGEVDGQTDNPGVGWLQRFVKGLKEDRN